MNLTSKIRTGVLVGAVIVLAIVGAIWFTSRSTAPKPDKQEAFTTTVDRGISSEDMAKQRQKIVELEANIAAQESGKEDISLWLQLGNLYYGIGELGSAVEQYDKILAGHPTDGAALENKGQAQLEMGDYDGALASWNAAILTSPYEVTYIRIADMIHEYIPSREAEIQTILEEAIANLGQTTGLLSRLGRWYADNGKLDEAISHYEVAYRLDPSDDSIKREIERLKREKARQSEM